jgi:hypothetical protein
MIGPWAKYSCTSRNNPPAHDVWAEPVANILVGPNFLWSEIDSLDYFFKRFSVSWVSSVFHEFSVSWVSSVFHFLLPFYFLFIFCFISFHFLNIFNFEQFWNLNVFQLWTFYKSIHIWNLFKFEYCSNSKVAHIPNVQIRNWLRVEIHFFSKFKIWTNLDYDFFQILKLLKFREEKQKKQRRGRYLGHPNKKFLRVERWWLPRWCEEQEPSKAHI